jgi:hypothetical protein
MYLLLSESPGGNVQVSLLAYGVLLQNIQASPAAYWCRTSVPKLAPFVRNMGMPEFGYH